MGLGSCLAIAAAGIGSVGGFIAGRKNPIRHAGTILLIGVFIVVIDLLFSWAGCLLQVLNCRPIIEILMVTEIGILKGASIFGSSK